MSLATSLFGPLVVPECNRAVGRGWLLVVRTLAALMMLGIALILFGIWWFQQQNDPNFQPYVIFRVGMFVLEMLAVVVGLILAPAVMAGSLAGEKERGSLYLLLTTSATPREIVLGRLTAKMSQVVMILLAAVPAFLLVAAFDHLPLAVAGTLVAFPMAVALGAGGLSAAASVLSRRGRDALMSVYLLIILLVLTEIAAPFLPSGLGLGLSHLSPVNLGVLDELVMKDRIGPAWASIAVWIGFGVVGTVIAAWRLRPACLGTGNSRRRGAMVRHNWVPVVSERPMLWKELFIERTGTLGRFGKFVGIILVVFLGPGSIALAATIGLLAIYRPGTSWEPYLNMVMGILYAGFGATVFGYLLEIAVGLRAAVAISSERERNTWDSLLTSPLGGEEIIVGKLWGSLYALRWLALATLISWVVCLVMGVMTPREFVYHLAMIITVGIFLAAVGVRISLATATATRSMSLTIGIWLAAGIGVYLASWVLAAVTALFWLFCWYMAVRLQLTSFQAGVWSPITITDLQKIFAGTFYLVGASLIASEARLRFDRIAGRMAGGELQVAIDKFVHGEPQTPVRIDGGKSRPTPEIADGPLPPDTEAGAGITIPTPVADSRI